jgi:Protein of unknown function (DUF1553)/Protein of unknown function (DUF1549)/Planctomycete cytochrome C
MMPLPIERSTRRRNGCRSSLLPTIAAFSLLAGSVAARVADDPSKIDFNRDIRPILSDKCFQCHGPDSKKRKADLRLDLPESTFGAAASGERAVVPGKLDESQLFHRITSTEDEEKMPPPSAKKPLTPSEIERLKAWIEAGAPYPRHWAFVAPVRPRAPGTRKSSWVKSPIDAFILARLEKEGLAPSPEADRATLIRRLSLDLIGLPPTVAEVDAFVADKSANALETVVERLLASPHYGERWARLWLDAARYADSDGYEKDKLRQVWFFRDWVANALNRDLPYNQFIIDQIAGDMLPGATQDQIVATGFLRNSMINEEGGVDPEQFRMEAMFDRMDAIGKSVLGLTIQCAQCHTHKFDPITQEDYYRLFAFLNDSHEANVAVYTPDEQMRKAEIFNKIREVEAELKHRRSDWADRMASWEKSVQADQPEWIVLRPSVEEISTGGQKYLPMDDGSLLAQGYAPTKHRVKMTVKTDVKDITAFRLDLLNDANLPLGGPGRSIEGTGALTEFSVEAAPADEPGKNQKIKIARATADINPPETPLKPIYEDKSKRKRVTGPVEMAIDGKEETAWGIDAGPGRSNQPRKAVFTAEKPVSFTKGTVLTFYLQQNHGGWNSDDNQNCNLGRMRLSITTKTDAAADPLPQAVREILAIPADQRSASQSAAVFSYWRTTAPEWKAENDQIEALWRQHPQGSSQLVLDQRSAARTTHMLQRGDFLKPGKPVGAGVPAFLHPLRPGAPVDRLAFARWLVDRNAPTTARAIVNRVWQADFGIGLVGTSEDLGIQSETPSHPALLDWLAVEFMERGWSVKTLHRTIVTSATYRQASRVSPELQARNPYNRLLARGPRFRVDAEVVRDIALAVSGLLNDQVGGPSVFPPAPEFLFQPPTSYGPKVWKEAQGADRYRRALYTFRYRSVPYPALQVFDAPNGDFSCVRRTRSNTPLQALTTLNETIFLECARALAARAMTEGGASDLSRVAYIFRRAVARLPTERESDALLNLLHRQERRFSEGLANPAKLFPAKTSDIAKLPEGTSPAQLAAWTAVSRVLLNLDETITKE